MDNLANERGKIREPKWRAMAEAVGGKCGEKIVEAMKELYAVYTPDVIDWFASLYDVESAGWYYSASARDNDSREYKGNTYLLRPDLESTAQALGFFEASGAVADFPGGLNEALPEWMRRDLVEWTVSLQDEDGYFYHEHWGKRVGISRRGRDLMWANGILRRFGAKKKFLSVSDGEAAKNSEAIIVPKHLKSKENFAKYLESKNINENSYSAGHELACQADLLKYTGMYEQCMEFLDAHQYENGLWHKEENYYAINGVMKISCVYNSAHRIIPHATEIAKTAIRVLLSDESVSGAVDLFNPWFAIGNLYESLCGCGEEGKRIADEITCEVREAAPEAIRATARKVLTFKKESGSFSYCPSCSSQTSQGMPVALENTWEGDINGYILSATGLITHLLRGLRLTEYRVPLFIRADFDRFIELIEKRREETLKK